MGHRSRAHAIGAHFSCASSRTLLGDLATVTCNTMAMVGSPDATFVVYPQFTPVQARAFELLGVNIKL